MQIKRMNRTIEKKELIQEVMQNFNFERVARVMQWLDWKWAVGNKVPSEQELKSFVEKACEISYDNCLEYSTIGHYVTGGFDIRAIMEDDSTISLSVKFVLTEWDAYSPED